MKFDAIRANPAAALMHLERYVNKGSPSGFLAERATSPATAVASLFPFFDLPLIPVPVEHVIQYHSEAIPESAKSDDSAVALYPCHPDVLDVIQGLIPANTRTEHTGRMLRVTPTASARTVYVIEYGFYIKLHYPRDIGRFSRANPWHKWTSSFENCEELVAGIESGLAPEEFALLRETAGLFIGGHQGPQGGAGVMFREDRPFPFTRLAPIIPFFSLFSNDRIAPDDPPLFVQWLKDVTCQLDFAMHALVEPLLRCFRFQAIDCGLLPENNAQNLLLEFDGDAATTRIVHRDMMGTFKDFTMRRAHGLTRVLNSYHSVDFDDDPEECFRRRSFAYDFKTGEYVLREIETLLASVFSVPAEDFRDAVRSAFRSIVTQDVEAYFGSKSTWWSYANVHPAGGRPYIRMKHPKYR
jgi:hypothetical protein